METFVFQSIKEPFRMQKANSLGDAVATFNPREPLRGEALRIFLLLPEFVVII